MNDLTLTAKLTMQHPEAFIGKVIDSTKWVIPAGYARCALTGKLFAEADLTATFNHHLFDHAFLVEHGIYVEDADWLSQEGYERIMDTLDSLGLLDDYIEGRECVYLGADQPIAALVFVGDLTGDVLIADVPLPEVLTVDAIEEYEASQVAQARALIEEREATWDTDRAACYRAIKQLSLIDGHYITTAEQLIKAARVTA